MFTIAIAAGTPLERLEILGLAALAAALLAYATFLLLRRTGRADRWWENGSHDILTYAVCVAVACVGWIAGSWLVVGLGAGALLLLLALYAMYERFG